MSQEIWTYEEKKLIAIKLRMLLFVSNSEKS